MLNVGKIEEGFVLDHIQAGKSLAIYEHLGLDKLDCTVAIIKNARSDKLGKKDILKVECGLNDKWCGIAKVVFTIIFLPALLFYFVCLAICIAIVGICTMICEIIKKNKKK
jgi:hypothetical protein